MTLLDRLDALARRWATVFDRALPGLSPCPIGPVVLLPSTFPADRVTAAGRVLVDILVQDALDFLKGGQS